MSTLIKLAEFEERKELVQEQLRLEEAIEDCFRLNPKERDLVDLLRQLGRIDDENPTYLIGRAYTNCLGACSKGENAEEELLSYDALFALVLGYAYRFQDDPLAHIAALQCMKPLKAAPGYGKMALNHLTYVFERCDADKDVYELMLLACDGVPELKHVQWRIFEGASEEFPSEFDCWYEDQLLTMYDREDEFTEIPQENRSARVLRFRAPNTAD